MKYKLQLTKKAAQFIVGNVDNTLLSLKCLQNTGNEQYFCHMDLGQ